MAIDSTAELLFKIGADTGDAEGNIAKFRTLLSKDLEDIGSEFESWSNKILGEITTVQAAMTAGAAVLAAGIVAVGVAVSKANEQYDEYVNAVSRGIKVTGLHAEQMSTMYLLAEKTGTSYDALVAGLTRFSSLIVRASQGNAQAQQTFKNLGISQDEVIAGQKDLWPVLEKTMDWFHNNSSAVQKAAEAKAAFSRDPALIAFLSKGSQGLEDMAKKADEFGITLRKSDIVAAEEFKLALRNLKEEQTAFDVAIGKATASARIWCATVKIGIFDTLKDVASGKSLAPGTNVVDSFFRSIAINASVAEAAIRKEIEAANAAGKLDSGPLTAVPDPAKIKEATSAFYGLDTIIESINSKIAASGTKYTQLTNELQHYGFEIQKASENLKKAHDTGTITEDEFQRNTALLAQMPDKLTQLLRQSLGKLTAEERTAANARAAALDQAHAELTEKLAVYDSQDYEHQRANLEKQMAQLRESTAKKAEIGDAENALLSQIREAGLNRIARDEQQAFLTEIEQLQQHLEQMVMENLSAKDKLGFQYQQDLRKFSEAEEAKQLALHKGEAQQATIRAFYDQIRSQSTQKYQQDLQKLLNSQGWRGVFGDQFASLIKGNEALSREWANTTNQSMMSVQVTVEALKKMMLDAFNQLANSEGQAIAHAVIYKQSVGEAMRAAATSTLESLAAMATTKAIYMTAEGLADLATGNFEAAGKAFASAAMFGSVGAAAMIAGRAIAPKDSSSTSASGSGSSSAASGSSDAGSASSGSGQPQPTVIIHINGSVIGPSGAAELCDIINQAVYGNDATLYASHNRVGVPIG
jgi:hypothetical protein